MLVSLDITIIFLIKLGPTFVSYTEGAESRGFQVSRFSATHCPDEMLIIATNESVWKRSSNKTTAYGS